MRVWLLAAGAAFSLAAFTGAATESRVSVRDLTLNGTIEGENIVFELAFDAEADGRDVHLPLVLGNVVYLDGEYPRHAHVERDADGYHLALGRTRAGHVRFRFASRAAAEGDWRHTTFSMPRATIRALVVTCDRDDLEVQFPGAMNVTRARNGDGRTEVTAYLAPGNAFEVRWKPAVKKLAAELVVSCEANSIATAGIGALRTDTVFTYRIVQGLLSTLTFDLPQANITQIHGNEIQDWHIEPGDTPRLVVTLGRPQEDTYRLRVESEMALPRFPCQFELPVPTPRDVIRASGFAMVGTDSAIRLQVRRLSGLTQIDGAAFPTVTAPSGAPRPRPTRGLYAYQFAAVPFHLELGADDIVTTLTAEELLTLSLADNELSFVASVQLDIKDAPARELRLVTDRDPAWTVTAVTGQHVSEADTDVREENGQRIITVPFKQTVAGTVLVTVRMEKTCGAELTTFEVPRIAVLGARSERGYLVVAAEKGVRLTAGPLTGMRAVQAGSAPMRVEGAQQAFRFKEPGWTLTLNVGRTLPSIHAEAFHLVSLGEGAMYYSATINYDIEGAPVRAFRVKAPPDAKAVEFVCADMEGWTRDGDTYTVRLQTRTSGNVTLLATYDRQFAYEGAELTIGGMETADTESEVGYIAVASAASLRLETVAAPPSIIPIDRNEIPRAYSMPVADPIIGAYSYVRNPHAVTIRVTPYDTEPLLGQVCDCATYDTTLTREGEALTTATFYIKNASRQYFVVSLPGGSTPRSITAIAADGTRENVLSQQSGERVLIPVRRPADPNAPIEIEVVYPQTFAPLGLFASGVRGLSFALPALPDTHATFLAWTVRVPERFAVLGADGDMAPTSSPAFRGFRGVVAKLGLLARALADGPGGRGVIPALSAGCAGTREAHFARTVSLRGRSERALSVRLRVVPWWLGGVQSYGIMTVALMLGITLACVAGPRRRHPLPLAAGVTAAAFGVAQGAAGCTLLAVLLAIAATTLVAALSWRLLRLLYRQLVRGLSAAMGALTLRRSGTRDRRMERALATAEAGPRATPTGGFTVTKTAVMLLGAALVATALATTVTAERCAAPPVIDRVILAIDGPGTARDLEQTASVSATLTFRAPDDEAAFIVLPPTVVLTGYELGSDALTLSSTPKGYVLRASDDGDYRIVLNYRIPVNATGGVWNVTVPLPDNLRNAVTLTLPEDGLEIRADTAVFFRELPRDGATAAEAMFGPASDACFSWRPRARRTTLEQPVFFCDVNTLAMLGAGVVELSNLVRFQVARGELKELVLHIPASMSVTSVQAADLATWSFDPDSRCLDAILEKPVSGDFTLAVMTQLAREGLPYGATVGAIDVKGAGRRRGALAVAAPDTIQVRIAGEDGLSPMNVEDFPADAVHAVRPGDTAAPDTRHAVRRAFRYDQPDQVALSLAAEKVLPELRVSETGTLSIADERIVLATRLTLAVAKTGLFSVELHIPPDFDLETLTGRDVSHWDEPSDNRATPATNRAIRVHFTRQVADETELNLVLARMERGIEERIRTPRVDVIGAHKHIGRLTVTGERGVRLMLEDHRGVDIRKAGEKGVEHGGVHVFDILRPNWEVLLQAEVLAPTLKPTVLQCVDLAEGMLQYRTYLRYRIENAGVKQFRLRAPAPGVSLAVTGRDIARVHEVDGEPGLWQVELHDKQADEYAMTVNCQIPYDPAVRKVVVRPLQTVGTEAPRGYLVVTCAGRLEVTPAAAVDGLKVEDARGIPGAAFGAGDLSNAVRCYRTLHADYVLELSIIRHESAGVLPATIERVRLRSVLSGTGTLVTRATLDMTVGSLRFLSIALPHPDDAVWTAQVNGRDTTVSRDGEHFCIPLAGTEGNRTTRVDFVYAGASDHGFRIGRQRYSAPTFGLPLNDIQWTFHVEPGPLYYGFGGTMERLASDGGIRWFSAESYRERNAYRQAAYMRKAREVLDEGEELKRAGHQALARKAFEQALCYSQGHAPLNEDARVQLRNLVKQQVKVGLVNRRDTVRYQRNRVEVGQLERMRGFRDGDFTEEYGGSVEQRLSEKDSHALDVVADRLIEQQAAAAHVISAIRITIPEHGRQLTFYRRLRNDPTAELTVEFRTLGGTSAALVSAALPAMAVFLVGWAAFATLRASGPDRTRRVV